MPQAVGYEIGARLPWLARTRACRGQAGAPRFVWEQIGQGGTVWTERLYPAYLRAVLLWGLSDGGGYQLSGGD
ncbi:hypothetical protein GCM10010873_34780 [Cypionkella aquatica]|uniref:Uncharacterized protein n=1 Tax=Cypionkella aquatica TaxID=1756042 RepID=A0AA37X3C1_9RHOB|nr:hypothetical protein GCM10010873_34780 [Cypionkella aquatica]